MISKLKYFFLFIPVLLLACSDEEPRLGIFYQKSEIADEAAFIKRNNSLETFTFSEDLKNELDKGYLRIFESFSGETIVSFVNGKLEIRQGSISIPETYEYRFEGEDLYLHKYNDWIYYGSGNENGLTIYQHCIAYWTEEESENEEGEIIVTHNIKYVKTEPRKSLTFEEALKYTPYGNADGMEDKDVLTWRTRAAIFL